ncbi:alpha/beta hydrolase [Streptomyces sp. V4-01]|uniref:Alpha/beta hydrolase n=1 Tax=Actinacidiphila polyblastidii TaxID=3110430 RepID=A0ABU7PDH7_9ACTN|nr:alpha/beta hydrolase [Streptomyces sp. V4-01]
MSAPAQARTASWYPDPSLVRRGTVVLLPGRGEHPGVYERFGRRLAADAYVVHVLDVAPDQPVAQTAAQVARTAEGAAGPLVLAGSDTGALHALAVAAGQQQVDALLLAGTARTDDASGSAGSPGDWAAELAARTACPAHRGRLDADPAFARGSLGEPVPAALAAAAGAAVPPAGLPVLVVHGAADEVSPPAAARRLAARLPAAHLATVAEGRHDALNDIAHRSVAATVVQWLERLRAGAHLPVVITVEEAPPRE